MIKKKYNLSYSSGGLHYQESVIIAELYHEINDWKAVKIDCLEKNRLQTRTQSHGERVSREVISRLKELTENQLNLLIEGTRQEQGCILWLAICKRYRFIRDFAIEVIREKFLTMEMQVFPEDYDAFFNRKADWHDELEKITETTQKKAKQVIFRILREVDILSTENIIAPMLLPPQVVDVIEQDDPSYMMIFPIYGEH